MRPLVLAILLLCALPACARGGHGGGHSSYGARSYSHNSSSYGSRSYTPRSYASTPRSSNSRSYATPAPRPRTYSSSPRTRAYRAPTTTTPYPRRTTRTDRAPRSTLHESKRSAAAKDAFMRRQPCPSTGKSSGACPGYVVDHRVALACGGADDPSNMQWQTTTAARLKDKTERKGCR